jgi:hypothetical protein
MKKRYTVHFTGLIIWVLLYTTMLNANLFAQTEEKENTKNTDTTSFMTKKLLPILNNFKFVPSEIIEDPFINTYIKLVVGSGLALDLNTYVKDLEGNIQDTVSGDISYISADIQFQLAVNNWLAFNISAGGYGRIGTNTYTMLSQGVSYATNFTVGGKAKLWQNEQMMLSTTLDFKFQDVFVYSIYDYVKDVAETGSIDSTANLLTEDQINYTFINLNYAWAPADWWGITALAGFGVGEAFLTEVRGNFRTGLTASVDFNNINAIEFPIGLLGSIKYNSFGESGSAVKNLFTYSFKIAYTGNKDFDIGIENVYQSLNHELTEEEVKTVLSSFCLRYYF